MDLPLIAVATVFHVRPIGKDEGVRERAFAEQLVALRLALGGLEAACAEDPARCRRAAAMLERVTHEVEMMAAARDEDPL